ncbi:uncharacterized protein LOC143343636 isoform X1 [Colletes latitarsis]|uniref:uncharacterized protein LOC143343636 isoform X1 n=1 Tax=Colletes latitarsis TaxID=2605962 RepID=UPI0040364EAC
MDISSMLEVQVNEVKEVDSKENVTPRVLLPSTTHTSLPISPEESNYYKLVFGSDVSNVRFQKLHCTACDIHIGSAPADAGNMFEHPVLRTLLCSKCREFYGDGTFEQGDDATDMFCRWCANGGNLYCCSFCSNTFCCKCIKRNIDPVLRKKIEADEKWKCFVCDPKDLYPARAICWALLEYVQRMNRLLQHNCKFSPQEVEEKLSLDESNCCARRRKRKRRRTGSNSEEEDETYIPKPIAPPVMTKRRRRGRGRGRYSNGSNISMSSSRSYGAASEDSSIDHTEILPSLLSCEQTMVECENATVNTDGTIISQTPQNSLPSRGETSVVQPPLYNTFMNMVSSSNFITPAPPVLPIRHVPSPINQMTPVTPMTPINSINQMGQMNQLNPLNPMNLYQAMHCTSTPMVTIPNQSADMMKRLRFSLPEPQVPPPVSTSPSVIEIDSDSEDVAVVGPSRNSRSFKDHVDNNKAVPVALVSSKNSHSGGFRKLEPPAERRYAKTLNQRLLPHGQEVDNILINLKLKLQGLFESSKQEELKKYELNDARVMIKQFHREIRDTVSQLACINDRIVREYNRWKRYQLKTGATQTGDSNNAAKDAKNEDITLEMVCVNESDPETENNSEPENSFIKPSEFVGTTNVVEGIKSFKKRITVSRAVGDDPALLVDKSVQIYDVELRDYDKCIRQSSLQKSEEASETRDDASTSAGNGDNKQPDNYEEQFINYLQTRTEFEIVQSDESKDLPDPNETPLKDLIEANSPFISEMLETMDKSVAASHDINNLNAASKEDSDSKSPKGQETNSVVDVAEDDFVKMVNDMTNNLDKKKNLKSPAPGIVSDTQKESKSKGTRFSTSDKIGAANVSQGKEDKQDSSRSNNCNAINSDSNIEDECTIIDD